MMHLVQLISQNIGILTLKIISVRLFKKGNLIERLFVQIAASK